MHLDAAPAPSPRLSGARAGARGFYLGNNGLLTPTLFLPAGREEEREKNGGNARANLQSAGGGGEEFVNQKRDLPASVIGWGRPVRFDRVKIASPMTGFGFGRLFEACFGALAGLVAPRLSFAPWFVPVGG